MIDCPSGLQGHCMFAPDCISLLGLSLMSQVMHRTDSESASWDDIIDGLGGAGEPSQSGWIFKPRFKQSGSCISLRPINGGSWACTLQSCRTCQVRSEMHFALSSAKHKGMPHPPWLVLVACQPCGLGAPIYICRYLHPAGHPKGASAIG